MTAIPQFNLDKSAMAFETDSAAEEASKPTGFSFDDGTFTLKVLNAYYNGAARDPNWQNVVVELGTGNEGDERSIRYFLSVPTTLNIQYQSPGSKKPTMFMWSKKFKPFFTSIGEVVEQSTLEKLIRKYLMDTKPILVEKFVDGVKEETEVPQLINLVGKSLEVDIGYEGKYIARVEDSGMFAVMSKGKVVEVDGVKLERESFNDCAMLANENNIQISRYKNVLKFHAKKVTEVNAFDSL